MITVSPLQLPSANFLIRGAILALIWAFVCLSVAAYLKAVVQLRAGYTRKLFHVLIFLSAAFVHTVYGFIAVCVFGAMVSVVVGTALFLGPGNRYYDAMARERDGPYRTYYIVVPYFATLIGALAGNVLFGSLAIVGYLVGGLGDAAGEAVGTRWGRHRYPVSAGVAISSRSVEGSLAVLAASLMALLIAVGILPQLHFDLRSAVALPVIAIVCALFEAVSPSGWDNVPMQFVPTLLAALLLSR
jgi:phytol kinase